MSGRVRSGTFICTATSSPSVQTTRPSLLYCPPQAAATGLHKWGERLRQYDSTSSSLLQAVTTWLQTSSLGRSTPPLQPFLLPPSRKSPRSSSCCTGPCKQWCHWRSCGGNQNRTHCCLPCAPTYGPDGLHGCLRILPHLLGCDTNSHAGVTSVSPGASALWSQVAYVCVSC